MSFAYITIPTATEINTPEATLASYFCGKIITEQTPATSVSADIESVRAVNFLYE
jgi:hypothetical protein